MKFLTLSLLRAFSSSSSACLMESSWERAEFPKATEVEVSTDTALVNPLEEPLNIQRFEEVQNKATTNIAEMNRKNNGNNEGFRENNRITILAIKKHHN